MTTNLNVEKNDSADHEDDSIVIQLSETGPLKTFFDTQNPQLFQIFQIHVFDYDTQKFMFQFSTSINKTLTKQQRTTDQFDWLVSSIKTKYPGIGIPVYKLPSSELNLAKQKCIVAELFLQKLCEHPIIKHSPEVQIFFLSKIQFVQKKKALNNSGLQFQGLSSWSISTLVSHLQRLTFKKYQPGKQANWSSQLKQLLQIQKQIVDTANSLKVYISNLKTQYKLDNQLIKKQSQILPINNCILQFQKSQISLRQMISQSLQKKKTKLFQNYMRVELVANIVMENLISYRNVFETMINIQISIDSNAYSTNYEKLVASQHYLQLLMNNLDGDAKSWLEYNNNMLSNIY